MERLAPGIARVCDDLLDFLVLAFAAWTAIYHVCVVLDIGALWAALAEAAALVPCAWLAFGTATEREEPGGFDQADRRSRRFGALLVVNGLAAVGGAVIFAFSGARWYVVWLAWATAAGAAVIATTVRMGAPNREDRREETPPDRPRDGSATSWSGLVALVWAVGLAVLSLFLVDQSNDDAQYVHLSAWVAAHGEFPVRDTLFSNEQLPAIIFPPLSSFEALAGTLARATGLSAPGLVYLVVTPLASALAVLALWRLLRRWSVEMVGLALSVSLVFLLLAAEKHRMLGQLFIARIWEGKIVFLVVLLPVLFALLHEYAERPTRRRVALLACAGAAAVGLTSTAVFIVPIVAAGCMLPVAIRSAKRAIGGLAATVAYPLVAAASIGVVGARNAEVSTASDTVPGMLVHWVLGDGVLALVALIAVLVSPLLIPSASAAAMGATTVLLVGCLYAPTVPLRIFELTGLGQVQWRWIWAVPTAALVGVLSTSLLPRVRAPAARAAAAVLLCGALAVWGTPVWSPAVSFIATKPAWKRPADTIVTAERILAQARPGEMVLASRRVSQTLLVISGSVTTVAPRGFYTAALRHVPGAHAQERLLLMRFAEEGVGPLKLNPGQTVEGPDVVRALRVVGVDIACVPKDESGAEGLLLANGYSRATTTEGVVCLRAPEPDAAGDAGGAEAASYAPARRGR